MNEKILQKLKAFEMTDYEARICSALMAHNSLTADKISMLTKIPPTRVYDVAISLMRKGLLSIISTEPRQYSLIPLKDSLKTLIKAKEEDASGEILRLKREYDSLMEDIKGIKMDSLPQIKKIVSIIEGKKSLIRLWHTLLIDAKKEVLVFSGDSSWIDGDIPRIVNLMKRGVDVRILCSEKGSFSKNAGANILKNRIKIRRSDFDVRGMVIDKKMLYISQKFLSDTSFEDYSAMLTEHKPLIETLREFFLIRWESSKACG
ncbi:MAG: helix-turn-helix domain-containing protein [Candidatus Aenigmatarchaeota archaeon]